MDELYVRPTKDEERMVVERLCQLFPDLKAARELAFDFTRMVRQRSAELLPAWLRSAARCKLKEFVGSARGISEDYEAVKNALAYEWSNGQLEGQVNNAGLSDADRSTPLAGMGFGAQGAANLFQNERLCNRIFGVAARHNIIIYVNR